MLSIQEQPLADVLKNMFLKILIKLKKDFKKRLKRDFHQKEISTQVFSCEIYESFMTIFIDRTTTVAASVNRDT